MAGRMFRVFGPEFNRYESQRPKGKSRSDLPLSA